MDPKQEIAQLKDEIEMLRSLVDNITVKISEQDGSGLNRLSSPEAKRDVSEVVYDLLSDYFFEKVNFTSFPFSQVGSGGTTSTSSFNGTSRITDTAEGKLHEVGNNSKTRLDVYFENPANTVGYVLSPAIYDSFASLNSFSSMDILRSYVGLKVDEGTLSVAVKQAGKLEELYPTGITLDTTGATDTYVLEVVYNGSSSSVYLDGSLVDNFNTNFILPTIDTKVFLPLLSPAKSTDGSNVNIVVENFQFLQDRK